MTIRDFISNHTLLSLPAEYETELKDVGDGTVAIRQNDPMTEGGYVLLTKSQALRVADALRTFAESN